MLDRRIGFIGAGQMATALARGFVAAGLAPGERIAAVDPAPAARQRLAEQAAGAVVEPPDRASALLSPCDVLFVAVKPQQMSQAIATLGEFANDGHLIVSIAAGISLDALAAIPAGRLARVMPNTPCVVSAGASAYALGRGATEEDAALIASLLGAVGRAYRVEEKLLDAVTGLSGSGPAFVYLMIEALADGGVLAGLPRDVALALASQTVLGSAKMVLESGEHPGLLKDRVASPAGTTIAGLAVLEEAAVRGALVRAVQAASARATELGQAK